MRKLFDVLDVENVVGWINNQPEKEPMAGPELFPRRKVIGLDFSWLESNTGAPTLLRSSDWDTKAEPIKRAADIRKLGGEMTLFKNSAYLGEKLRQNLIMAMNNSIQTYADTILSQVYNDSETLYNAALARQEKLRFDLLQTGQVVRDDLHDDDLIFVDYNDPDGFTDSLRIEVNLSNEVDVHDYIDELIEKIEDNGGETPSRALVNKSFFRLFRRNKTIVDYTFRNYDHGVIPTVNDEQIRTYFSDMFGLAIHVYDGKYQDTNGEAEKYVKDGNMILLPSGAVGHTNVGTTPEEADLMGNVTDAKVSIVDEHIAVTQIFGANPVSVETVFSMVVMPSFEEIKSVGVITFKKPVTPQVQKAAARKPAKAAE